MIITVELLLRGSSSILSISFLEIKVRFFKLIVCGPKIPYVLQVFASSPLLLCTGQFQNRPCPPPPGQTPGHLTFFKNFGQIPRYIPSLDGQMPHPLGLQSLVKSPTLQAC